MMKNKKKLAFGILITSILLGVFLLASFANVISRATYDILDSGMFTATYEGHTYKCYPIEGQGNSIAIAWGENPTSITGSLKLPSVITKEDKDTHVEVEHPVIAIAKAGFSRCAFSSVTVPQSVTEIKSEAFAYCQNLTTFQIPYGVTEIAPSTFLDCRNLTSVYYSSEAGKKVLTNSQITSIGDHAFDSCISLKKFNCPSVVTYFGESCFQKCRSLVLFKFPYDNEESGDDRNLITVKSYAFADCGVLSSVYFDINMSTVEDLAFADTYPGMIFYFYGTEEQLPTFAEKWNNMYINTKDTYAAQHYPVYYNTSKPQYAEGYPGLLYTVSQDDVLLDNARTHKITEDEYKTEVYVIKDAPKKYAIITGFDIPEPDEWDEDFYSDGVLKIPDVITKGSEDYPVRIIGAEAFSNKDEITSVTFNPSLTQIQHRAFKNCNNISELVFDDCTDLVEISYSIFNEPILSGSATGDLDNFVNSDFENNASKQVYITSLTSVTLPNCLEYLGNFAFYNFINLVDGISFKTDKTKPSKLKVIGDYAFAVNHKKEYTPSKAEVDIEFPNSLDDAWAKKAKVYHACSFNRNNGSGRNYSTVHDSMKTRFSAINKNTFDNQRVIRTAKMEAATDVHETSLASNVFMRCRNLIRFESNANLCLIGDNCFGTTDLREIFLQTERANNNSVGAAVPWDIQDGSLTPHTEYMFSKQAFPNLIIYIKASDGKLPKGMDSRYVKEAAADYKNEMTTDSRTKVPYYFVDWTEEGNVKYWHLNQSKNEVVNFNNGPRTLADYKDGYISIIKKSGGASDGTAVGNYTVARYFTDGTNAHVSKTIDLSSLSDITIDEIGMTAFASSGDENKGINTCYKRNAGNYFILPNTVKVIRERAFFRNDFAYAVGIVTYHNGTKIVLPSSAGESDTFGQYSGDTSKYYCCLSSNTTRVEKSAFYNNAFTKVEMNVATTYLGNLLFFTYHSGTNLKGTIQTITYNSPYKNANFETNNNGIYYVKNGDTKKVLVFQASGNASGITIASNTLGIGYFSCADNKLTSVALNNECTSIFGKAFANNYNLIEVTNLSHVKYIATDDEKNSQYSGYPSSDYYIDNSGSFENCTSLKVDFSEMTSIIKIGKNAFKGCKNIAQFDTPPKTYTIYHNTDEDANPLVTTNILDLSTNKTLTQINGGAFQQCEVYGAILPNVTGTDNYKADSKFKITSGKSDEKILNDAVIKFVGETAYQADQYGGNWTTAKNHYPLHSFNLGTLSCYANVYYRVHSTDDISTVAAGNSYLKYWTAIATDNANEVKIVTFDSYVEANAWLSVTANVDKIVHNFF